MAGAQHFNFGPLARPNRLERFRRVMDERGVQYAEDWFTYTLTTSGLAAGATIVLPINIQRDSVFELLELSGQTAGNGTTYDGYADTLVTAQLVDSVSSRNLMDSPVPLYSIFGNGANPFVLPIPRRFMPTTQLSVALTNISGQTPSIALSFVGRKLFKQTMQSDPRASPMMPRFSTWQDEGTGRLYAEDLYMYNFSVPSLAPTATATVTKIIEADSDFEWIETAAVLQQSGSNQWNAPGASEFDVTMQVLDGGSDRNLLSQATLVSNVAGYGLFPFVLKQSRLFQAKTPVQMTVQNINANNTYTNINITMIGRKIFELAT